MSTEEHIKMFMSYLHGPCCRPKEHEGNEKNMENDSPLCIPLVVKHQSVQCYAANGHITQQHNEQNNGIRRHDQ